jgi:hypothetical protein
VQQWPAALRLRLADYATAMFSFVFYLTEDARKSGKLVDIVEIRQRLASMVKRMPDSPGADRRCSRAIVAIGSDRLAFPVGKLAPASATYADSFD